MKKTLRILKMMLMVLGSFFLILVILSFTTAPFWIWYNLGRKSSGIHRPPDFIVVMGGGGMPSESGLIRCWYAAGAANHFNRSKVIIALPGDTSDRRSSINGMKAELILRGISPERILVEDSGTNTRSQALNIFKLISNIECRISNIERKPANANLPFYQFTVLPSVLIVSSPEHLHRAVLSFRKAGFTRVEGMAAWEKAIESDLWFKGKKLGGRQIIPDIGDNLAMRYEFWTQMNYELLVVREWFALAYYWVKGWI